MERREREREAGEGSAVLIYRETYLGEREKG